MANFRALASLLGLAAAPHMAAAHGRMTSPMARNVIHSDANSIGNANAAVGGGPGSVHDGGRYLHGICGDAPGGLQTYNQVGAVQATYTAGQSAEFKLKITAHHMGFFEFELCDDAGQLSEECFARHRLLKEGCECSCPDGSNSCAACDACRRWWKPLMSSEAKSWVARDYEGPVLDGQYLDEVEFTMKYVVPAGVATSNGVIRWHYMTTNSCTSHSSAPEEFWNCADVAIADGGSTGGAVSFDNGALVSQQPQDLRPAINGGELEGVYSACPKGATGELLGVGGPDDYLDLCGSSNQYCVRTDGEGSSVEPEPEPEPETSPEPATQSPSPTAPPTPAPTPAATAFPGPAPTPAATAPSGGCAGAFGGPCSTGCLATNNVCYAVDKAWCDARAGLNYIWCEPPALVGARRAQARKHAFLGTALLQTASPLSRLPPADEL